MKRNMYAVAYVSIDGDLTHVMIEAAGALDACKKVLLPLHVGSNWNEWVNEPDTYEEIVERCFDCDTQISAIEVKR